MKRAGPFIQLSPLLLFGALAAAGCGGGLTQDASGVLVVNDVEAGPEVVVPVSLGEVFHGSEGTQSLSMRNAGRAPLTLISATLTDTTGAFQVEDVSGVLIRAGETLELPVTFRPSGQSAASPVADFEATLDLTASGTVASRDHIQVHLTGRGVDEGCQTPESMNFGVVAVGQSHTLSFRVKNQASLSRAAGQATLSDAADSALFSLGVPQEDITPLAERELSVTFWPAEARAYEAGVDVAVFEGCPIQRVALTGEGREQVVVADPLNFGFVPVGFQRRLPLAVKNLGPEPVTLTQSKVEGPGAGAFTLAAEAAWTIPARGEATVELTCEPGSEARFDAELTASTDVQVQPEFRLPLRCHGGGPRLVTEPEETLDFGRIAWVPGANTPVYQVRRLNLRNLGTSYSGLAQERLYLGKDGAPPFLELVPANENTGAHELSVSMARSYDPAVGLHAQSWMNTLPLDIRVTPDSVGLKEADLIIHSNDFHRPELRIRVRAEAAEYRPCSYSISPPAIDFGRVNAGTSRELSFRVRNEGTDPLDVCLLSNLQLTPESDAAFSLTNGPVPSVELGPGSEIEVAVEAAPPLPAPVVVTSLMGVASFNISSPEEPMPQVPLAAQVGRSCLVISPTGVDFGAVDLACAAPELQPVEIRNTCPVDIVVESVAVASGAPEFGVVGLPSLGNGLTLKPHQDALKFEASFAPLHPAQRKGWIEIRWNDAGGSTSDVLSLEGLGAAQGTQVDEFQQGDGVVDVLVQLAANVDDELFVEADYHGRAQVLVEHLLDLDVDFHLGTIGSVEIQTGSFSYQGGTLLSPPSAPDQVLHPNSGALLVQAANKLDWFYHVKGVYTFAYAWPGYSDYSSVMRASRIALSPTMLGGSNAGFIRDPARLAVLHVNRDDRGVWGPANHAGLWEQPAEYLADFVAAKGPGRESEVVFGAFTTLRTPCFPLVDDDPALATTWDELFAKVPVLAKHQVYLYYRWLAEHTGGYLAQYCIDLDWVDDTQTMAEVLAGVRLRFPLSQSPDFTKGPLVVRVNGTSLAATSSTGELVWQYEPARNRVKFELAQMPPKGSTVELEYPTSCP